MLQVFSILGNLAMDISYAHNVSGYTVVAFAVTPRVMILRQ